MSKICIIGAGWVGCHLTKKLRENNDVVLYEKDQIFSKSSLLNQNRLHLGYHYARNFHTRNLCKTTFEQFSNEYDFLLDNLEKNIYAVSNNESLIDFKTYLKIFEDFSTHKIVDIDWMNNIEGSILVKEKYINPKKAKEFFEDNLSENIIIDEINETKINSLKQDYDLVINCTNNSFFPIIEQTFSENCTVLLYKKINKINFDAITLVDGSLFSIYPYENNLYTLTDVEYTPKQNVSIMEKRKKMEEKVLKYYPSFFSDFEYVSYFQSVKNKVENLSAFRSPIIKLEDNFISCFTGKIQGIYFIENFIKSL
jgi:hypothetical protein